jgi:uncharacterized protein YdcH (DUF465 family)
MAEDNRLIEVVTDLLLEVREMKTELKGFRQETDAHFNKLEHQVERLEVRAEKLEEQQAKTTLAIGELRLSVMKMSDDIKALIDLDKRVRVLESIVLKAS